MAAPSRTRTLIAVTATMTAVCVGVIAFAAFSTAPGHADLAAPAPLPPVVEGPTTTTAPVPVTQPQVAFLGSIGTLPPSAASETPPPAPAQPAPSPAVVPPARSTPATAPASAVAASSSSPTAAPAPTTPPTQPPPTAPPATAAPSPHCTLNASQEAGGVGSFVLASNQPGTAYTLRSGSGSQTGMTSSSGSATGSFDPNGSHTATVTVGAASCSAIF